MRPGRRPVSPGLPPAHSSPAHGPAARTCGLLTAWKRGFRRQLDTPGSHQPPHMQVFSAGVPVIVMHEGLPGVHGSGHAHLHLRRGLHAGPGPHGGPEEGQGCQRSPDALGACSYSNGFWGCLSAREHPCLALLPSSTGSAFQHRACLVCGCKGPGSDGRQTGRQERDDRLCGEL